MSDGEATLGTAKLLGNKDKLAAIRKNLPFLLDQSNLTARFRLNVSSCRLNASNGPGEDNSGQVGRQNERVPQLRGNDR